MPDPPSPRLTLGDLANRALAVTDPEPRARVIAALARSTRAPDQVVAVAERLLASSLAGRRVFLEWVTRVRGALPPDVLAAVPPLLSVETFPPAVRVAAAARALRAMPHKAAALKKLVPALTAGLSPLRALERLRQLQHQLRKSRALDALIERRERRVKMDCPRCGVRLRRVEMVRHLWHEHGLLLDQGKVRGRARTLHELRERHAAGPDSTTLDRVSLLADPAALRAWAADTHPPPEDVAPLLAAAADRGAGLCPGCFAELPAAVPPLPPPLVLSGGRLTGEGYTVEVSGENWFQTRTVVTPRRVLESARDRVFGPRGAATLAAACVVIGAVVAAQMIPVSFARPVTLVFRSLLAAALVYAVVWFRRKPLPEPAGVAVDAAWTVVARGLVGDLGGGGVRFLTRLCRASVGRGDPVARVGVLTKAIEWATANVHDHPPARELLAAATYLQVEDTARLGRDRVGGVAGLIAAGFRDTLPATYSEAVAECYLNQPAPPSAADLARLRVLLVAAAFDAGLRPRDLVALWAAAPNLRRAMAVEPLHRLGLLYGVWVLRHRRPWEEVEAADTVFELCRVAPTLSGRLLSEFPDLLLYHQPGPRVEEDLGPVLVCSRGVVVGGRMAADPDSVVQVERAGRLGGGFTLSFGSHQIGLSRRLPDQFVGSVRHWLRFRARFLPPLLDGYLAAGAEDVLARVLRPFGRKCPRCKTASAVAAGQVGTVAAPAKR